MFVYFDLSRLQIRKLILKGKLLGFPAASVTAALSSSLRCAAPRLPGPYRLHTHLLPRHPPQRETRVEVGRLRLSGTIAAAK